MEETRINAIIEENSKRRAILFSPYNPITGEGSPIERKVISYSVKGEEVNNAIPLKMYEDYKSFFDLIIQYHSLEKFIEFTTDREPNEGEIAQIVGSLQEIRFDYDFEYWAYTCAKIQDKETKQIIPFKLNRPQRRLLARLEKMRMAGVPIRLILLKARQWGGSTLTQIYMGWIQ
jgi:hypothetical protein